MATNAMETIRVVDRASFVEFVGSE